MASLSLGHTALSCMLRSRAVGALGKLQGDGLCLDPFPPPRVSLVRPGRVHSHVLGPWRATDHSKPTPNQKGVAACSPGLPPPRWPSEDGVQRPPGPPDATSAARLHRHH